MMGVIATTLEAAPSDSARKQLLETLPAPPAMRVIMGLTTLSPEADAFKMLKPLAKEMDPVLHKMFKSFAKMSDAEIEQEIKDDQAAQRREGRTITSEADLLRFPPDERRRKFVAGLLAMGGMMQEDGEFDDSDDEFGFQPGDSDDSDDDDSDEDVDPATLSPTERKFKEVLASLEQTDCKVMFLAEPYDEAKAKAKDLTAQKLLAVEHLMLPAPTVDVASRYSKRADRMVCGWPGGGTSCGNAVWHRFLRPALAEAEAAIERRDCAAALGPLLGILLIGRSDEGWLRDQEEYCEWDSFAQWFADLSRAWQTVLAEPDGALGLASARGRKEVGHYRGVLLRMLTEWEQEVNETLEEFEEFAEGGKKAKLTATKKVKVKQPKGKGRAAPAASGSSGSGKRRRVAE